MPSPKGNAPNGFEAFRFLIAHFLLAFLSLGQQVRSSNTVLISRIPQQLPTCLCVSVDPATVVAVRGSTF